MMDEKHNQKNIINFFSRRQFPRTHQLNLPLLAVCELQEMNQISTSNYILTTRTEDDDSISKPWRVFLCMAISCKTDQG